MGSKYEQIGDLMENIVEIAKYKMNKKVTLSEEVIIDITNLFTFTIQTLETTYKAIFDNNSGAFIETDKELKSGQVVFCDLQMIMQF